MVLSVLKDRMEPNYRLSHFRNNNVINNEDEVLKMIDSLNIYFTPVDA
jgi:hypothetical protein